MIMLRNKELLIYSAAVFVITAVSAAFCLTIDISAGIICLLGCLCISGVFIFFTMRRYRKISELCSYLHKITIGDTALDIRDQNHALSCHIRMSKRTIQT